MTHQIKIIGVSKDKKKDYYKVETNNGNFLFTESLIVKYSILKDNEFSEDDFMKILNELSSERYFLKSMNYISYQMRSEKEIKDYLLKNDANIDICNYVIEKLKKMRYLDDVALSKHLLKEYINKKKGPNALFSKLKMKGISNIEISETLNMYTLDIQRENIDDIASKFISENKNLPIKKQKEKLYSKLIYNGFDLNIVNEKINSFNFVDESDERLKAEIKKLILKYQDNLNDEAKKKIYNKLMLRGYEYHKIRSYYNEIIEDI